MAYWQLNDRRSFIQTLLR